MSEALPRVNVEKTGWHIRELIWDSGMSAPKIAEMMGLTTNAVYKWIYGECLPTIDNLVGLAHLLGVEMADILVIEGGGD